MPNINKYTTLPTDTSTLQNGTIAITSDGSGYILSNSGAWTKFTNNLNITQADINKWNDASAKAHTHPNKDILDSLTWEIIDRWDTAYNKSHTHNNFDLLETIKQTDLDKWNSGLRYIGVLGATQNLNTVTTNGIYNQPANANATTANNYPINIAGVLIVYGTGGTSHIVQEYVERSSAGVGNTKWRRYMFSNVWGSWQKSLDDRDVTDAMKANWNQAFAWGNHATAGYLTQTIGDGRYLQLSGGTLVGDVNVNNGKKFTFTATDGKKYDISGLGLAHTSGSDVFTTDFINATTWGIRHGAQTIFSKDITNNVVQIGNTTTPAQLRIKSAVASDPTSTLLTNGNGDVSIVPQLPLFTNYLVDQLLVDSNTATTKGIELNFINSTTTNRPTNFSSGTLMSLNINASGGSQLAISTSVDPAVYFRNRANGTWGLWNRLATTNDLTALGNDYISKTTNDLPANSTWYVKKGTSGIGVVDTNFIGFFDNTTKAYITGGQFKVIGGGINVDGASTIGGVMTFNAEPRFVNVGARFQGTGGTSVLDMSGNRLAITGGNGSKIGNVIVDGDNPIYNRGYIANSNATMDSAPIGTHSSGTNIDGTNGSYITFGNTASGTQSQILGTTAGLFKFRSSSGTTWNSWKNLVSFEDLSLTSNETSISLTFNGVTKTTPIIGGNITAGTYSNNWNAQFTGQGYIDFKLPKVLACEMTVTIVGYYGSQIQNGAVKYTITLGTGTNSIHYLKSQVTSAQGVITDFYGVDLSSSIVFHDDAPHLRVWSLRSDIATTQPVRIFIEIKTKDVSQQNPHFSSLSDVTMLPFVADTNIPTLGMNNISKNVTFDNISLRSNAQSGDNVAIKMPTANIGGSPANSNGIRIVGTSNTASGYLYFGSGNNRLGVDVGTANAPLLYNGSEVVTRDYAIKNGFIFSENSVTGTINAVSTEIGLPANSFKPTKSGFYRPNKENNWGDLALTVAHPNNTIGANMASILFDYSGTNAYLTGTDGAGVKLPNKKILTESDIDLTQYWKIWTDGTNRGFNNVTPYYFLGADASTAQRVYTGGLLASPSFTDGSKIPTGGIYSRGDIATDGTFNKLTGQLAVQLAGNNKFRSDSLNSVASASSVNSISGFFVRPLGDLITESQTLFAKDVIKYSTKQKFFERSNNITKFTNVNAISPQIASVDGSVKITMPSNLQNAMWTMKVRVISYTGVESNSQTYQLPMELSISGYSTTSGGTDVNKFINIGARVINEWPNFNGVRFGYNTDGNKVIWIDLNGSTAWPRVIIDEVVYYHSSSNSTLLDGDYIIEINRDETGYTNMASIPLSGVKSYDRALRAFPTSMANAIDSVGTPPDLGALSNGNYSAGVSVSSLNIPIPVGTGQPGGLISFGAGNQTTRILGARDGSDNLWFQSGAGSTNWLQLATRNYVATQLNNYIPLSQKGQPNGVATLGADGFIPSSQLPSYVDDVIEFPSLSAFPTTGETGKIYIATDTNQQYRWSGTQYVLISSGAVQSVNGKTGVVVLNKADIGLGNVDNTADNTKSVLSATKWTTPRTFTLNGDVTASGQVDGSANVTFTTTLPNIVTAGSYKITTVNAKGQVTGGSNPTTLAGFGITDAMSTSHPANAITNTNINNWNTAFNRGDFRTFGLGVGNDTGGGIVSPVTDFANWNTEVGWETRFFASSGVTPANAPTGIQYPSGIVVNRSNSVQSQLVFGGHGNANGLAFRNKTGSTAWGNWVYAWTDKHFTQTNINNWNTAFGWGNHASAGYVKTADLSGYVKKTGDTMSDELIIRANGKPMTLSSVAKTQNYLAWLMYDNSKAIGYIGANGGSAVGDGGSGDKFVIRGTVGLDLYTDSGNVTANGGGIWTTNHFENQDLQNFFTAYNENIVSGSMNTSNLILSNRVNGGITIPIPQFNQNTTGNAGSATKLQTARTIKIGEQSGTFDGTGNLVYSHNEMKVTMCGVKTFGESWNSVVVLDTRGSDPKPDTDVYSAVTFEFKTSAEIGMSTNIAGVGAYAGTIMHVPFTNSTGNNGSAFMLAHSNGVLGLRPYNGGVWQPWKKILTDSDISTASINNWNQAYSWGNHATAGYMSKSTTMGVTSFNTISGTASNGVYRSDLDPTVSNGVKNKYSPMLHMGASDTMSQMSINFQTGEISHRGGFNGTWQDWRTSWDNVNLPQPMTLDTNQTVTGSKGFTQGISLPWAFITNNNGSGITCSLASQSIGDEAGLVGGDDDYIAVRDFGVNEYIYGHQSIRVGMWGYGTTNETGHVGIRTSPNLSYPLYIQGNTGCSGTMTAVGFYESSRREFKTNIKPFEKSGLDLVNDLEIVTFDRKDNEDIKNKIGVIIDDTPEEFASVSGNEVDLYKTTFIQAKAIQELSETVEKQSKEIEELKELVNILLKNKNG